MTSEILDRRVRRTRAKLRQCLTQLLTQKKIQDISVKEISELADLNRGTFYLHYHDVYDLLDQIEKDLFQQFTQIIDRYSPEEVQKNPKALLVDLLYLIRDNTDLYRILTGPNGDIKFLAKMREVILTRIMHPWGKVIKNNRKQEFPYYYSFITEGTIGMIKPWVENGTEFSPEEIATLINHFVMEGASWIS